MALVREPEVLVEACPICGEPVVSEHHIKPRSAGGSDEPRNKVWLCHSCHDIVEMIYTETGLEYSPALISHIRRAFNLGRSVRGFYTRQKHRPPERKRAVPYFREPRVKKEDFPKIGTCAFCGNRFERTKSSQAVCQVCVRKNGEKPPVAQSQSTMTRKNKKSRDALSESIKVDLGKARSLKRSWHLWLGREL